MRISTLRNAQILKHLTVKLDVLVLFTCQTLQANLIFLNGPVDRKTTAAVTRKFLRPQESAAGCRLMHYFRVKTLPHTEENETKNEESQLLLHNDKGALASFPSTDMVI